MKTHLVLPDVQVKPGVDVSYLKAVGDYMVEKKPDRMICLGDFADMPSLSVYDFGKRKYEGRRYHDDIAAAQTAMDILLSPLHDYNENAIKNRKKRYHPTMDMFLGNHEDRIDRAINEDAKLTGTLSIDDLGYETAGWTVHPYLVPVVIDGIAYSHYFASGVMNRAITSARALVTKKHMSCIQGHNQKMEIYNEYRADGQMLTGLFAGCCYLHDEDYLGPQGNNYFRGIHMLYEVEDGQFQCHSITLDYLLKRASRR